MFHDAHVKSVKRTGLVRLISGGIFFVFAFDYLYNVRIHVGYSSLGVRARCVLRKTCRVSFADFKGRFPLYSRIRLKRREWIWNATPGRCWESYCFVRAHPLSPPLSLHSLHHLYDMWSEQNIDNWTWMNQLFFTELANYLVRYGGIVDTRPPYIYIAVEDPPINNGVASRGGGNQTFLGAHQ